MSPPDTAGRWRTELALIRTVRAVGQVMALVAGVAIVFLMLLTVTDIGRRQFIGLSIPGAIEVTEVALVAVVFAGMMSAEARKVHVRTPVLVERLPPRVADAARLLGMLVVIGFLGWAVWLTLRAGLSSFEIGEYRIGLTRVPVWPSKMIVPFGYAGLLLVFVAEAVQTVHRLVGGVPVADDPMTDHAQGGSVL